MSHQAHIYISYSTVDIETARRLYGELKKAGATPWMDEHDLLPGQNRKLAIRKAIKESDYVITLLSSRSVSQRGFVHKEQKMALDLLDEMPESDIFIIPVRVDDCDMPFSLDELQPTDLFPDFEPGFEKILKGLKAGEAVSRSQGAETGSAPHQDESAQPVEQANGPPSGGSQQRPVSQSAEPPPESPSPASPSGAFRQSPVSSDVSTPPEATGQKMPPWVLKVSIGSALAFLLIMLVLAVFIPHPTTFQIFVFRIVLALAAAAFGATIPGFLKLQLPLPAKGLLHAGGAIVLFVLIFMVNPPELIAPDQTLPPITLQKLSGTILDRSGEPLPDVLVSIPEKSKETRTNKFGLFSFEVEAEKSVTVRIMAMKDGFTTYRKDIPLGTTGFSFAMEETR